RLQSSQDPLNFPIKLNNKIAALQGVIESADVKPTEQAYSVFRTLSNSLDEQLGHLETTTKTRMPSADQLLQRQKVEPIKAEPLRTETTGQPGRKALRLEGRMERCEGGHVSHPAFQAFTRDRGRPAAACDGGCGRHRPQRQSARRASPAPGRRARGAAP